MKRCSWVNLKNKAYIEYHDNEWGRSVHNDRLLFEIFCLEIFMTGLSWECVLNKRQDFKNFFENFEAEKIIKFTDEKETDFLENKKLIRNKQKYLATINNAKIFLEIQKKYESFDKYIWAWTNGKIIKSDGTETKSELSDKITKDLKSKGMKFIGTTTIFAYLCAIGIISAHEPDCDFQ